MKLKSHRGLKKRVIISGRGKILFKKACKNHLLLNKSKRQKRLDKGGKVVHFSDDKKLRRLLPYF